MPQTDPRKRTLGSGAAAPAAGAPATPGAPAPTQKTTPAQPAQGAQAATPAAQPTPGTGFVNLATILAANRDGAARMAQQLAGSVRQQGQQAQQAIKTGQNTFNAATAAATPGFDPNASTADAQTRMGATYKGPKDWASAGVDVAGLAAQANDAQERARALTSQGGRAALLREQAPGLTAGGASMDAFLAGAGGGQDLQQVSSGFGSLADQLRASRESAGGAYEAALRATADNAQRYRGLLDQRADAARRAEENAPPPDPEDIRRERERRQPGRRTPGKDY